MKFSLIMATINRVNEVKNFLISLSKQNYKNFELIIVDQNPDDRLSQIIEPFLNLFSIIHIKSDKGLSRARNNGLKHVSGDLIAFPDDDCEYPDNLLEQVRHIFDNHPDLDGITGRSSNHDLFDTAGRFDINEGKISIYNVWRRGISFTIFVRRRIVDAIGGFDISLGLGADTIFLSGEETDFLIKSIKRGFSLYYFPQIFIYHPNPLAQYSAKTIERGYKYGCGWGKVLQIHQYPSWFIIASLARPLAGTVASFLQGNIKKSNYHLNVFKGRLCGLTS